MKSFTHIFLLMAALFTTTILIAQPGNNNPGFPTTTAPDWNWAMTFGGSGGITGVDITRDNNNNLFVTGYFNGLVTYGSTNITSSGWWDLFFAKFDGSGNLLWIKTIQSTHYEMIQGSRIRLDNTGNIIICGKYSGTVTIGTSTLVSSGGTDAFIAKFDNTGNPIWAVSYGDTYSQSSDDLTLDDNNNAYIVVSNHNESYAVSSEVLKCTPAGTVSTFLSANTTIFTCIYYKNSYLALSGYIYGPVTIGSFQLFSNLYPSALLVKTDLAGVTQWAENFTSTWGNSRGQSVIIDNSDNIYTSGIFTDSIYFHSQTVTLYGLDEPYYLTKFSSSGVALWADGFVNDDPPDYSSYIRLDNSGNPFLFAYTTFLGTIGPSTINWPGPFFAKIATDGTIQYALNQAYTTNMSLIDSTNMIEQVAIANLNDMCLNKIDLNGNVSWIKKTTSNCGYSSVWYNIAVDHKGFCYIHGDLNGSINYNGTTIYGQGAFLARISGDRQLHWVNVISGNPNFTGSVAMSADQNDNSYVLGYFQDTLTIGQTVLINPNISTGGQCYYVAKFNESGSLQWAKSLNCTSQVFQVGGITTDGAGNVVIAGSFMDTILIGSTMLISQGYNDALFAKFSSDGTPLFAKSFGSTGNDYARSLAIDGQNNIILTGGFQGTVNFGTSSLTSLGGYDAYTAKYDANGNELWVQQAGGSGTQRGHCVNVDNSGNIYVSGLFYSSQMTLGSITLTSSHSSNLYVAKYSSGGTIQWAHGLDSQYFSWPAYQIGVDEEGSCYVGGQYEDTLIFHDGTKISGGLYPGFLAKYSTGGDLVWYKNLVPNNGETVILGIAVFDKNSILAGGRIDNDTLTFDSTKLVSANGNAFLAVVGNSLPVGVNPDPIQTDRTMIYPNPADHYVYISLNQSPAERIQYAITEQNGAKVVEKQVPGSSLVRIELPYLPSGLYYLTLKTGTSAKTWKLIINH
ncbi:MAG: T9SS type A sorting domain-containing protein [Bacteroidales bacterium]|jgi:hypothetical protein